MIDLTKIQVATETKVNSLVKSVTVKGDEITIVMKRNDEEVENKKGTKSLALTSAGSRFGAEPISIDLGNGKTLPGKLNVYLAIPTK